MAINLQAQWTKLQQTKQNIKELKAQIAQLEAQERQIKQQMVEHTFVCTPKEGEKLAELKGLDQVDLDFAGWGDVISGKILYRNGHFYTVKNDQMICGSTIVEGGTNSSLQKVVDWKTNYTNYRYQVVGELNHTEKNRTYWYANHCRKLCWYALGGWKNQKGVNWTSKNQQYWIELAIDNGLTPKPKVKHVVVSLRPEITESEAEAMEREFYEDRLGRYGY